MDVYLDSGNHDLENFMAASFRGESYTLADSVTEEEFAEIPFAPEMLGLPEMEQENCGTNTFIQELSILHVYF